MLLTTILTQTKRKKETIMPGNSKAELLMLVKSFTSAGGKQQNKISLASVEQLLSHQMMMHVWHHCYLAENMVMWLFGMVNVVRFLLLHLMQHAAVMMASHLLRGSMNYEGILLFL